MNRCILEKLWRTLKTGQRDKGTDEYRLENVTKQKKFQDAEVGLQKRWMEL